MFSSITLFSSIAAVQFFLTWIVSASDNSPASIYFLSKDIDGISKHCAVESDSRLIVLFRNDDCFEDGCSKLAEALRKCEVTKGDLYIDAESVPSFKYYVSRESVKNIEFNGIYIKNDDANAEEKISDVLSTDWDEPRIVVIASSFEQPLLEFASEIKLNFQGQISAKELKEWAPPGLVVDILSTRRRSPNDERVIDLIKGVELIEDGTTTEEGLRGFLQFVLPVLAPEDIADILTTDTRPVVTVNPPLISPQLIPGNFVDPSAKAIGADGSEYHSEVKTELVTESLVLPTRVSSLSQVAIETESKVVVVPEPKVAVVPEPKVAVVPEPKVAVVSEPKVAVESETKSTAYADSETTAHTGAITSTVHPNKIPFVSMQVTIPIRTSTTTETHTTTVSSKTCDDNSTCEMATSTASFVVRVELCVSIPTDCVVCQPKETRFYKCLEGECPQDKVSLVTRDFGTPVTRVGRSAVAGEGWSVEAQPTKSAPIKTIILTACEDQTCRTTAIPLLVESSKPPAAKIVQSDLRAPSLDHDHHDMLPERMVGGNREHHDMLPESLGNSMGPSSGLSRPRVSSDKLGQPHRHMSQTGAPTPSPAIVVANAPLSKASGIIPSQTLVPKPNSHSNVASKPVNSIENFTGMAAKSSYSLLAVGALILALV